MSEPFPELDGEWDYKGDDPAWQLLYRWHKSGRAGAPLTKIMSSSSNTGLHELARQINAMLAARAAAGHAAAVAKLREPSIEMLGAVAREENLDVTWEEQVKRYLRAAADALEAEKGEG